MTSASRIVVAALALVGSSLAVGAGPAAAGAGETGCPEGYETLSITEMVSRGYTAEHLQAVDENGDGTICGKPVSARQQEKFCESIGGCYVDVIYSLRDNNVARR